MAARPFDRLVRPSNTAKAPLPPNKTDGLPRSVANTQANNGRALPTKPNENNVNNAQSHQCPLKPKHYSEQPAQQKPRLNWVCQRNATQACPARSVAYFRYDAALCGLQRARLKSPANAPPYHAPDANAFVRWTGCPTTMKRLMAGCLLPTECPAKRPEPNPDVSATTTTDSKHRRKKRKRAQEHRQDKNEH